MNVVNHPDGNDPDNLAKIIGGCAVIVSAFVAGMLGFYAQWKIKQLENARSEKKEKEGQKHKFYTPLLRCLYELDDRLDRIINRQLDSDWLDKKYLDQIKNREGFAASPNNTGYFIISSVYLIACFFGLTEAIKKGIDTTKFPHSPQKRFKFWSSLNARIKKRFNIGQKPVLFQFYPDITIISRIFVDPDIFKSYMKTNALNNPTDACKLHKHIQHSIGEMMLEKEGKDKYRLKSFREFYNSYISDESFRFWFVPIEQLFSDLSHFQKDKTLEKKIELKNDIRPLRLLTIQYWCRILMKNISKELDLEELNLETRSPDNLLNDLSPDLKKAIASYKLENSQSDILSLKINHN